MNDDSLDDLLGKYSGEAIPPVPGNLESRVWREIRARQSERELRAGGWLRAWRQWREPRLALASVVAAAAVGVGMSWWTVPGGGSTTAAARSALDLSVFSAQPPSLPSTLLARGHE